MTIAGYLLDENMDPRLAAALRQEVPKIPVRCVGERVAPALGAADPGILLWCEAQSFALVTKNRSSMPGHLREHLATGHHVPAVFILARRLTLGQIRDELVLIWGASKPEEYRDQIVNLPLHS